jgi:nitrate reductase gamma subunit
MVPSTRTNSNNRCYSQFCFIPIYVCSICQGFGTLIFILRRITDPRVRLYKSPDGLPLHEPLV